MGDVYAVPPNETTSPFLSLPRELRDLIYSSLINNPTRPAPLDPDHAGSRFHHGKIYFEAQSPRPALLQLKLCNVQIYSEVTDALERHGHQPRLSRTFAGQESVQTNLPEARIDIMVKGSSIYPTWTSLPSTPHLEPSITVTLRLFESEKWGSEFSTGAYRGLWSLFNLLASNGPCLTHNRRKEGLASPLVIEKLRFDIVLCSSAGPDDLFGTHRDVFNHLEKLAFDSVGLGRVKFIEAYMGSEKRFWRLQPLRMFNAESRMQWVTAAL